MSAETWTCSQCTLENTEDDTKCAMCGTSKPRPASAAHDALLSAVRNARRTQSDGASLQVSSSNDSDNDNNTHSTSLYQPLVGGGGAARAHPRPTKPKVPPQILCGLGCSVFLVSVILFSCSFSLVGPTQYGLLVNRYTGKVDSSTIYDGGRYFVFLRHYFLLFPSTQTTMEFSDAADSIAPPMIVRTGKPQGMKGVAGGQRCTISLSFQYQIHPETLPNMYEVYGMDYPAVFVMLARQVVSDVTQSFVPKDFWVMREVIAQNMTAVLNQTMWEKAFVTIPSLQLLEVDFSGPFEYMIEKIQLQQQQVQINMNQQLVQDALNVIDVMKATTQANITAINAQAAADSLVIVAKAQADALKMKQQAKAQAYKVVQDSLEFSEAEDLLAFMRVRAMRTHNPQSMVVGTDSPAVSAA